MIRFLKRSQRLIFPILLFVISMLHVNAQSVGINDDDSSPDASAILDVKSDDKGLLIPRMTSTQRANISSPAKGLLVFDETTNSFWFYSGGWKELADVGANDGDWYMAGTEDDGAEIDEDIYRLGKVAIGKDTADYPLDMEGNASSILKVSSDFSPTLGETGHGEYIKMDGEGEGSLFGTFVDIQSSGGFQQGGAYYSIGGTGGLFQIGATAHISNSGDGSQFGFYSQLNGDGDGTHIGLSQSISGDGTGSRFGVRTTFTGNGTGTRFGVYQSMHGVSNAHQNGSYSSIGTQGDGSHTGSFAFLNGNGSGPHYGAHHILDGSGDGDQFGVYNNVSNGGAGKKYGTYNLMETTGGGRQTGTFTLIQGTATGFQIGEEIRITNNDPSNNHWGGSTILESDGDGIRMGGEYKITGSGDGNHFGVFTELTGTGNGQRIGGDHRISGDGDGNHYGVYTELKGGGNGFHYGYYNFLEGNATGNQYGIFNDLKVNGDANHAGVWTRLSDSGNGIKRAYAARLFGSGNGMQYGFDVSITNGGSGDHYGADISLSGIGVGTRYGVRSQITGEGDGPRYASYNHVSSVGAGLHVAGYFDAPGGSNDYAAIFDRGNIIANDAGGGFYFRAEGINDPNALVVNGGLNNNVGIGIFDAACDLEIVGPDNSDAIQFDNGKVRLRHHYDVISSDRDFFHILIDANNDQDNSVFRIYKNVSEGLVTDASIQFSLDGQSSWIDLPNLGVGRTFPSHPLHMGSGAHVTAAGVWTNASDRSKKKDISEIKYGLDEILNLLPRSYAYKVDDSESMGFIAQEIEKVMPELVSGEEGEKGVAYGLLTAVLVKAVQEQQSEIDELKAIVQKQQELIESVLREVDLSPRPTSDLNND